MPNNVKLKALLPWPTVTLSGVRVYVVSPAGVPVVGISAGRGISSVAARFLPFPFGYRTGGGGSGAGGNAPGGASSGLTVGDASEGGAAVSLAFSSLGCARAGPAAKAAITRVVNNSLSFIFSGPPKPTTAGLHRSGRRYGLPKNKETARGVGDFSPESNAGHPSNDR